MTAPHRPPFRADQVGSLLRPATVVEARARHKENKISNEELRSIEDDAIRSSVARQEEIGLFASTDGEFRRTAWHMDFISSLGGIVRAPGNLVVKFENEHEKIEFTPDAFRIDGRLRLDDVIFAEDFRFLNSLVTTSMAMPQLAIHVAGCDSSSRPRRTRRC